jgi:hypothetical protein
VRQLVTPWTLEQQHSIEVLVEDITLATASIAALNKQKGGSLHILRLPLLLLVSHVM